MQEHKEYEAFRIVCPLTGKTITDLDCFDISLVAEGLSPESEIDDSVRPIDIEKNKAQCLCCKWHPK